MGVAEGMVSWHACSPRSVKRATLPPPARAVPEEYTLELFQPPIPKEAADAIYELCLEYGPHYPEHFGKDMLTRLRSEPLGEDGNKDVQGSSGLISAVMWHGDGSAKVAAAHASVIYDPTEATWSSGGPEVGLLGAVITSRAHRKKGLARAVTHAVVRAFDAMYGQV